MVGEKTTVTTAAKTLNANEVIAKNCFYFQVQLTLHGGLTGAVSQELQNCSLSKWVQVADSTHVWIKTLNQINGI